MQLQMRRNHDYISQESGIRMYLCLCNGLKERDVTVAAGNGAPTTNPKEAYARLGKSPQCGVCLCAAREMLKEKLGSGGMGGLPA